MWTSEWDFHSNRCAKEQVEVRMGFDFHNRKRNSSPQMFQKFPWEARSREANRHLKILLNHQNELSWKINRNHYFQDQQSQKSEGYYQRKFEQISIDLERNKSIGKKSMKKRRKTEKIAQTTVNKIRTTSSKIAGESSNLFFIK